MMRYIQWFISRLFYHIDVYAGLAWSLFAAGVFYIFFVFLPAQQTLAMLKQELLTQPEAQQIVYTYTSPAERIFNDMPHIDKVTEKIQTIFDIASQRRIVIEEVSYSDKTKADEISMGYSMSFSIVAPYPVIRVFISDVLNALPYIALNKMTFERDKSDSEKIISQLVFTLYLVRS